MDPLDHWTDSLIRYWFVPLVIVGALIVAALVYRTLRNRPQNRTSAMERLIARNPAITFDDVRWTRAAQRVRFGWLTSAVVAVALLIATDRPRVVAGN